ncbi:unnamed protein product [Ranitomeya imitator]|uniref:Reverse transcriptase n=1 Tax=Ranitomeya imitator TaxID=111125 RepID=A0ABN9M222_9NEOB|nr:unnamed protein product [Ranitomeya imitator]
MTSRSCDYDVITGPALERPAMMSRSCDRNVNTGPTLMPTLGPEAAMDYRGPSESLELAAIWHPPYPQKEISDLKVKISSTEQQLKSTSTPEDFKSLKEKMDKTITDLRDNLQNRKRNKFLRDTEDYKSNQVHFSNIPDNISTRVTSPESRFSLDSLKLRVRSSFQPPHTHHPVETYIHFVEKDVKRVLESIEQGQIHIKQNLTRDEHNALISLRNNKRLIIKPADKGGSIVVLDRDYYIQEIYTQLGDVDTYQLVNSNPSFEIAREIKKFITHYLTLGIIDEKLGNYLLNQHPVLPVLYTLLL